MQIVEWTVDWEAAEVKWIEHYKAKGSSLLNVTKGGLDMSHVTEACGKFPAYSWVMRFCSRINNNELAGIYRKLADEAKGADRMTEFDASLRALILEATPLARV